MGCLNQQLLPKFWAILLTRIDKWDGTHENEFGLVSNTKLNVIKLQRKKLVEKNWVICLVYMFPFWVKKCPKKSIFYNFTLTPARNLSLFKQFMYKHLKNLITFFQKMVWYTGVRATVHEILVIKISKQLLTQQKFNKVHQFQILISPKQ